MEETQNNIKKRNQHEIKKRVKDIQSSPEELHQIANKKNSETNVSSNHKIQNFCYEMEDWIKTKKEQFPEKHFTPRNSLLTDLLALPHFRTLYSIFIALMISLFVNAAAIDLVKKGRITLGFDLLPEGLNNFHVVFFIWICMFVSTVGVYGAYLFWANTRIKLLAEPKPLKLKIWDGLWFVSFIIYCFCFVYCTVTAVIVHSLQIIVSIAVTTEMTRILMKIYAFVRSNAPRTLKYKPNEEDQILCPEFSKYLYFSFAPTLIYRDSYPRTRHIRWNYVALCFAEVVGILLCMHLVRQYIAISSFEKYNLTKITWQDYLLIVLQNGIPYMFIFICMIHIIWHCWQNAFAEMLRFADRLFYKDWWNATTFAEYYRSWSSLVHDWLYYYIYKDMSEIVLPGNKIAARATVHFVSVFFHEIIIGVSCRFYIPVLLTLFFIAGVPISFVKFKSPILSNSLIWYTVTAGFGWFAISYQLEYDVRIACPIKNPTIVDYFIPRIFTCNIDEED